MAAESQSPDATPDPVGQLRVLAAAAEELAQVDWRNHSGQEALDAVAAVESLSRAVAGIQAKVLPVVQNDGLWALGGQRTFTSWLTNTTGSTRHSASRAISLATKLNDRLPHTRTALIQGTISVDHAHILARKCTQSALHHQALLDEETGEEFLVETAQRLDAGRFAKVASQWAVMADPEGADRNYRKDTGKEEFILAPTLEGYHISGWLTPANGQILAQALAAHAGRKSADDARAPSERNAAALLALAHQSLDAGLQMPTARIRPHLTITMGLDTIRALAHATGSAVPTPDEQTGPNGSNGSTGFEGSGGSDTFGVFGAGARPCGASNTLTSLGAPAEGSASQAEGGASQFEAERAWANTWKPGDDHVISTSLDYTDLHAITPATLADGTPLPPTLLARFTCESMLMRVIFGPQGTILDAGREKRIFPTNQTRAIIARDRHCQYPGCDEGPEFGEIHHSLWWAKHNGTTHVDQGILLCWHHHGLVHTRNITITRRSQTWQFTDRYGNRIHPPFHTTRAKPPNEAADDELYGGP